MKAKVRKEVTLGILRTIPIGSNAVSERFEYKMVSLSEGVDYLIYEHI